MEQKEYYWLVAYHFYDGKREGYGHAVYGTDENIKTAAGIEAVQNAIARNCDVPDTSVVILNIVELEG